MAVIDAQLDNSKVIRAANELLRLIAAADGVLVDVPDVEILKAGIEYPLASGPTTFTPEDLADAVAAVENPNIQVPRIKLGHDGPLTAVTSDQPALGVVKNMRVSDDGQTILGDYTGVPIWLAEIMASAYPSRSIEGNFDVEKNGHTYRLVITNVSLLGVAWPGCSSIEDIQALYSRERPDDVKIIEARKEEVMAGIAASVSAEDVRRAFYEKVAVAERNWWWITAQYVDPPLLIAEDESGNVHHVKYKIKGDEVEFDEPKSVHIQYVEDDTGKVAAEVDAQPEAVFASRAESVRGTTSEETKPLVIINPTREEQ